MPDTQRLRGQRQSSDRAASESDALGGRRRGGGGGGRADKLDAGREECSAAVIGRLVPGVVEDTVTRPLGGRQGGGGRPGRGRGGRGVKEVRGEGVRGVRAGALGGGFGVGEEEMEGEQRRFEEELEFVQCLASPWYLNCGDGESCAEPVSGVGGVCELSGVSVVLAAAGVCAVCDVGVEGEAVLMDRYPACLHHLRLLESAGFRAEISRADVARRLNDELYYVWLDGGRGGGSGGG
ncbi:hypothetical protein PMAC_001946 [Pneumocystis sp. 'macacae']|nr:hypothetical protein PMAC_001946 [Pneumocystis sp. 'macacae']